MTIHGRKAKEMTEMILLVGASGLLGGMIANRLLERGDLRILTRDNPAYQQFVDAGAQPVGGDLKDRATLGAACQGAEVVVTTASATQRGGPDTIESVDLNGTINLIDAAKAAGVRHFIYVSTSVADANSEDPYFRAKAVCEQHLRDSGMTYTILAPHIYMEVLLGVVIGIPLQAGQPVTLVGKGDHAHSFISVGDVAAFAAAAIENTAAHNQRLLLGGPEPVTWSEIVTRAGKAIGRDLETNYVPIGTPIPLLPEVFNGFMYAIESFELPVEMEEMAQAYGVALTPVEQVAGYLFGG